MKTQYTVADIEANNVLPSGTVYGVREKIRSRKRFVKAAIETASAIGQVSSPPIWIALQVAYIQ
jgi:hypothetical protein